MRSGPLRICRPLAREAESADQRQRAAWVKSKTEQMSWLTPEPQFAGAVKEVSAERRWDSEPER
jgi:hypothetical protein